MVVLSGVVLLGGMLVTAVVTISTGFTGAPPPLYESVDVVPVSADSTIPLDGDRHYVVVGSLGEVGSQNGDATTDGPTPGEAATEGATLTVEPECLIVDPAGVEVDHEVAANWDRGGDRAVARFETADAGTYEVACASGDQELEVGVAPDGTRGWEDETARRRLWAWLPFAVTIVGSGVLFFTGTSYLRTRRTTTT